MSRFFIILAVVLAACDGAEVENPARCDQEMINWPSENVAHGLWRYSDGSAYMWIVRGVVDDDDGLCVRAGDDFAGDLVPMACLTPLAGEQESTDECPARECLYDAKTLFPCPEPEALVKDTDAGYDDGVEQAEDKPVARRKDNPVPKVKPGSVKQAEAEADRAEEEARRAKKAMEQAELAAEQARNASDAEKARIEAERVRKEQEFLDAKKRADLERVEAAEARKAQMKDEDEEKARQEAEAEAVKQAQAEEARRIAEEALKRAEAEAAKLKAEASKKARQEVEEQAKLDAEAAEKARTEAEEAKRAAELAELEALEGPIVDDVPPDPVKPVPQGLTPFNGHKTADIVLNGKAQTYVLIPSGGSVTYKLNGPATLTIEARNRYHGAGYATEEALVVPSVNGEKQKEMHFRKAAQIGADITNPVGGVASLLATFTMQLDADASVFTMTVPAGSPMVLVRVNQISTATISKPEPAKPATKPTTASEPVTTSEVPPYATMTPAPGKRVIVPPYKGDWPTDAGTRSFSMYSRHVNELVAQQNPNVDACYFNIDDSSDLEGRMVVRIVIRDGGTSTDVDVPYSSVAHPELKACFEATFMVVDFSDPSGMYFPKHTVYVPIQFAPNTPPSFY
ncbi:MAG: hypothetical protein ABIA47_00870 [bacterium]